MSAKPIIIAHRGASAYLPEHSFEAKILAYGQGADFLEQDVVATRDHELVVLHDLYLDDVSNVRGRFPERAREDGHFYVIDFALAELRELSLLERRRPDGREPLFPGRFPDDTELRFGIRSLDEEIELVQALNRATRRDVGIYPEIKHPDWHREHGVDLAALLIATLQRRGYTGRHDTVYLQCFDQRELQRVRFELGAKLRLVQLIDSSAAGSEGLSADGLEAIGGYADVVAPHYTALMEPEGALRASPALGRIRDSGLELHTYTLRREQVPPNAINFERLLAFFLNEARVDGVFCDHPDIAVKLRQPG